MDPDSPNSSFDRSTVTAIRNRVKNIHWNSLLHEPWCCVPIRRIGPEPTTDRFMAIMHGPNEQATPGKNALAVDPTQQFGALQSFGNAFLSRFEASFLPAWSSPTLIETPGILSGEKQRLHRGYFNFLVFKTQEKTTKFQVRVQSTNRLMLPPTLSLCILLLIFRLLLQSGDVEANPGPTLAEILTLDDLKFVYNNLIKAAGNWYNLGLNLGLGYATLQNIRDKSQDNQASLCDMIAACFKTGSLTYSKICKSLRAPSVDRNDVAATIEGTCTAVHNVETAATASSPHSDQSGAQPEYHITSHRCKRTFASDEEVEIPPKRRRIKDIGAQNASGRPTESSEKGNKPVTRTEETTQSSRKRGRDADPPASNPKKAKAIQPGKIEYEQVLMKIGRELETTQSSRKLGRDADPPASNPKRAKAIQPGKIEGDQVLMKIGRELGVKWMDVGVALMKYKDLKNTIKDDHNIEHHLKPMEMFEKWKSKAGDSFTYATLASALEEVGLDTCAQTHCYE